MIPATHLLNIQLSNNIFERARLLQSPLSGNEVLISPRPIITCSLNVYRVQRYSLCCDFGPLNPSLERHLFQQVQLFRGRWDVVQKQRHHLSGVDFSHGGASVTTQNHFFRFDDMFQWLFLVPLKGGRWQYISGI